MKDSNAKAPKVRSGDDINPVLGGIIKISAIIVIAALIVLITVVIVKFVQKNKESKPLFDDEIRIEISLEDFKTLNDVDKTYDDVQSKEIKDVLNAAMDSEDGEITIYYFFYYSDFKTQLRKNYKNELDAINKLGKNTAIFIVDLSETVEEGEESFEQYIRSIEKFQELETEIDTVLDAVHIGQKPKKNYSNKKYLTFIISADYYRLDDQQPYKLYNGVNDETKETRVLELLKKI